MGDYADLEAPCPAKGYIYSMRIFQTFLLARERNQDRQNKKFMIFWLLSGVVGPGRD